MNKNIKEYNKKLFAVISGKKGNNIFMLETKKNLKRKKNMKAFL